MKYDPESVLSELHNRCNTYTVSLMTQIGQAVLVMSSYYKNNMTGPQDSEIAGKVVKEFNRLIKDEDIIVPTNSAVKGT